MREQSELPFLLRHSTIARVENGHIYSLDRRFYPFKRVFLEINGVEEAYSAIKSMALQGGAPLELAIRVLSLMDDKSEDEIRRSVDLLISSRPTNTTMKRTLLGILEHYGEDTLKNLCDRSIDYYDTLYDRASDYGERLIDDDDSILTTCFAEHTFILSLIKARENGKRFKVYVSETRPYMQGARLTEPSLRELGFDVMLITDNLSSHLMGEGKVNKYMTATDLALRDGTVVNKIGTLSNAISALYYGIPYYAFSLSFDNSKTKDDIQIEVRPSDEAKRIGDTYIASEDANYYYPAFDIIPSSLVSAIVTPDGIVSFQHS